MPTAAHGPGSDPKGVPAPEIIRFATGPCALGVMLVAQSSEGVCAMLLGDEPAALVGDLRRHFPSADLVSAPEGLERLLGQAAALSADPGLSLGSPLDLRGTPFQRRVWEALLTIPAGSTVSYRDLAERIGSPGSARAVAQACGANFVAVAVPCHRVVASAGGLSGYRWGVERKAELLRVEGGLGLASTVEPATQPASVLCGDGLRRPSWAANDPLLRDYYDNEWGKPVRSEQGMFEALSLEVFQSGLSWATILHKRAAFRAAFDGFDPERVAAFDADDVERLMGDAGIVRNRRKIEATIQNARATLALREEGGLVGLVWSFRPAAGDLTDDSLETLFGSVEPEGLAKALRRAGFGFVGSTTMFALMEAAGVLG